MARKKRTTTVARTIPEADNSAAMRLPFESPSYIAHLTRQRLLTAEEEVALALLARGGDPHARVRLIEANMRLVISIAKSYHSSLVGLEDLVQEGAIGLMTACERFDPTLGYRFSTYATHWIRQAISRALDNKAHAIRVPAHVSEALRKIERTRAAMLRETGEEPSTEQIAERLHLPASKVAAYVLACQDPVSLDMLVGEEENTSLAGLINDKGSPDPEHEIIRREIRHELDEMMAALTERERLVMRRRLGFDDAEAQVLQDIGSILHISRERVRQIEAQALRRLRAAANRRHLRDYLAE